MVAAPRARRAVVLFLPPAVSELVDPLRARWDPVMTARIGAHITLVHDVVDHDAGRRLVAAAAVTAAPFRVRLTTTDRWRRAGNGVYLHVEDVAGGIGGLQRQLAELEAPAWARVPYRAHVTLLHGRTVTGAAAEAGWGELEGFHAGWDADVEAIDVIELVEPRWRTVERYRLGGDGSVRSGRGDRD